MKVGSRLISLAMIGSYVMSFQVYLSLPLEVRRLGGEGQFATAAVAALFAVSGLSTIAFQTKVTPGAAPGRNRAGHSPGDCW